MTLASNFASYIQQITLEGPVLHNPELANIGTNVQPPVSVTVLAAMWMNRGMKKYIVFWYRITMYSG